MSQSALNALKLMYQQEQGSKLKLLELQAENVIGNEKYGCSFAKFLKGVVKPFDSRITDAMVRTTGDLVQKFSCATGYTSSDEISLIFNAANHPVEHDQDRKQNAVDKVHPYNGRMQKLASVTAGVASARFNYHLNNPQNQWQDAPIELQSRLKKSIAYFDSRVVPCPNDTVIMETVFWRSNFDAFRNAISQISFANYSNKELLGMSVLRQIEKLNSERGIDVFAVDPRYLFGTWVKKIKHTIEAVDRKTGERVFADRTKLCCGSFNWADYSAKDREEFLMTKFWDSCSNSPPKDIRNCKTLFG